MYAKSPLQTAGRLYTHRCSDTACCRLPLDGKSTSLWTPCSLGVLVAALPVSYGLHAQTALGALEAQPAVYTLPVEPGPRHAHTHRRVRRSTHGAVTPCTWACTTIPHPMASAAVSKRVRVCGRCSPVPARQHTKHVVFGIVLQANTACRCVVIAQPAQPHHLPGQSWASASGGRAGETAGLGWCPENPPK